MLVGQPISGKEEMILCHGQPQVKRDIGEPTGFEDCFNNPIRVGDRMDIRHDCNCDQCSIVEHCTILWNEEWSAYGMRTDDGRWVSGMGIAGGYRAKPNKEVDRDE
jgi:hypothetical protein